MKRARARKNDPATSHQAAASVDVTEGQQRALDAIRAVGPAGTTYHGILGAASYGRITELYDLGLIKVVGWSQKPGEKGRIFAAVSA